MRRPTRRMFAFAIDDEAQQLLMARIGSARSRCSTPRSTACSTLGRKSRRSRRAQPRNGAHDLEALEGYLSLGYFVAPATAYRHVRKLEPAHTLALDGARTAIRKYWDIEQFDTDTSSRAALLDEVEARLSAAVSQRLESEVPIGAFLSGGIDSGLVVSYMAEALNQPAVNRDRRFRSRRPTNQLAGAASTASLLPHQPSSGGRAAASGRRSRSDCACVRRAVPPIHRRYPPTTSARLPASTSRWRCRETAPTKRLAGTPGGIPRWPWRPERANS